MSEEKKQLTYADAGVDIDAGNKAVESPTIPRKRIQAFMIT